METSRIYVFLGLRTWAQAWLVGKFVFKFIFKKISWYFYGKDFLFFSGGKDILLILIK